MPALQTIYCDYAATSPLWPDVRRAMEEIELHVYGNPSSIHRPGQAARAALERARKVLARSMGAKPREVIFTSGGTEANNLLLFGLLQPGDHVVTSMTEHPSILRPLDALAQSGVEVTQVPPVSTGEIPVSRITEAIRPDTRLISVMAINNETGASNNITAIGNLAADRGLLFHTDAVQAFGKIPIHVEENGIHFLSASAHKIGGPKGIGLLYARQGLPLKPLILGGSQENQLRGGTENVAGAVGFARASELTIEHQKDLATKLTGLRQEFLKELTQAGVNFQVNGMNGYPGILNLRFPGIPGHSLVINLDMENVAASFGSSCASGSAKTSHVLLAMGLDEQAAGESVRFSFGYGTTQDEIRNVAHTITRLVTRVSPTSLSVEHETG